MAARKTVPTTRPVRDRIPSPGSNEVRPEYTILVLDVSVTEYTIIIIIIIIIIIVIIIIII